jgi:hypothetical protein
MTITIAVLVFSIAGPVAGEQKPDLKGPAAKAYEHDREAVARAKTVDELRPFVSKTRRGYLESSPDLRWFHPKVKVHIVEHENNKQESQARALGFDPARVLLPHPIQDRTDAEMVALADAALDGLLAELVA